MNLNFFQSSLNFKTDINEPILTDMNQTKVAMQILDDLSDILPGATIKGQLVSKDGTNLSLLLQNNLQLSTSLEADTNIMPGQILNFEVIGNDKGHLTVRPLHTNMASEETITKALDNANIRINNATIDMVDGLMKEGMPINKETLVQYNRYINAYPQADVKDFIMLNKMDMPVNSENVEQMHLYNNNNQWMMSNIATITDDITTVLSQMAEEKPEEFETFLQEFKAILETAENIADIPDKEPVNNPNVKLDIENDKESVTSKENDSDNNEAEATNSQKNIKKDIFDILKDEPFRLKNPKSAAHIKDSVNEVLSKTLLMQPKNIADKDYVKNYYEKIDDVTRNIEQLLEKNNINDSKITKDVVGIKNNINFMNQINEMYNYVQLPLKMADSHANGELYVYTKKKMKHDADEPVTALLHLAMDYLGNMDIFLKLDNGKLSTKFCLEKEENITFIENHIDELNKRLMDKGYNTEMMVTQMDDTHESVIDNIRNEKNETIILSEKGFDARA